ncbi:MAG: CoB--CoM heterodisulfide reductase iron-sulfur subunit A family protein [Deltaproteobacteria bacterium]|nr:CoB--CoM heterodisulfide reductase iron-sulfur subunit A family protein [Deltaproteobacteria bacterium]
MATEKQTEPCSDILVVGAGIGGLKAAMDLSEASRRVVLIDKAFSIGGLMARLDRTFPTNNCDLCTLSPQLSETGRRQHIELMSGTQLSAVQGEVGRFSASLTIAPRFIDLNLCTACGECYKRFPQWVRFTPGLDHRAPTCMRYPQATPYAFSVYPEASCHKDELVRVCPAGAILTEDRERVETRLFGAIILAAGAELFAPAHLDYLSRGLSVDVLTGLEYERILSASGPTHGELIRPSDGKPPQRIAWIQCVGSRGINTADVSYCSSVCCMAAIKEAIVTRERFGNDIETTIFYMDIRTGGKDYELYYQRALKEYGVRFVRCRPHSVVVGDAGQLQIAYLREENGRLETERFDMVVLSSGFRASQETEDLGRRLGIELNRHHFAEAGGFSPVSTSRPGIYVCGTFESPKDIPETIVQSSAAACLAMETAGRLDPGAGQVEAVPPERDVAGEPPRIGVFVCDCGFNIGGVIDVEAVVAHVATLPEVLVSEIAGHGCSSAAMERIESAIREKGLNRIVIGGCSPRTRETLFQNTLRKAGLNKYLVEIVNIRDQVTWVHAHLADQATEKAKDLLRMAVGSVRYRRPHTDLVLPMNKDVLVVGGGVSGMTAALSLASQGFKVILVERMRELGGLAGQLRKSLEGDDIGAHVRSLVDSTLSHKRIEVLTQTIIVDHSGMPGAFSTGLQAGPRMLYRQIRHGATILATGALPLRPAEHLLGEHGAVVTQLDLDGIIEDHPDRVASWNTVVMIQCVGSRTPENPNCSKICCQSAVKNILRIGRLNPDARIFVLYRDMRTTGFQEDYAIEARKMGAVFVRYEENAKPDVRIVGDKLTVAFEDRILGRRLQVETDCLALSTGFVADDEGTEDLAAIFHLSRTADGFFREDHVKLRPVELSVPGFTVAGTALGPKSVRESITQALAASARTQALLSRDTINLGAVAARVDRKRCAACLLCVRACPYHIPFINADGVSEIDATRCHGCGTCAAECPAKAIELVQFEDDVITAQLNGLLERLN